MTSISEDKQSVAEAMQNYLTLHLHKDRTIRKKDCDRLMPMFFTHEPEEDYFYDALVAYEDGVDKVNGSGTAKYALTKQGTVVCVRDADDKSPINLGGSVVVSHQQVAVEMAEAIRDRNVRARLFTVNSN